MAYTKLQQRKKEDSERLREASVLVVSVQSSSVVSDL